MNNIYSFLSKELVEAIGWTLFHSIWQAAVIAILLAIVLFFFNRFSAQTRYIISMISLLFILVAAVLTFTESYQKTKEKAEIARLIKANPQLVVENFKKALQENSQESKSFFTTKAKIKWIVFKSYFQRHFPFIFTVWLLGILFLILRFTGGIIYTNRMKYRNIAPVPEEWKEILNNLALQFKFRRKVKIWQSFSAKIPITLGYFKPVVLVPASLLTGLPADQIENIIAHELAHISRHDYLFNIIQSLIEILFFYHPAVWWISSVSRTEREHSCDDMAIEITGDSLAFAKALTNVQEQVLNTGQAYALAFSGNKNKLFNRIKRILTKPTMKNNFNERLVASCVIFAGFLILTFTTAFTADNVENENGKYSFRLSSGLSMTNSDDTIYSDWGNDSIKDETFERDYDNDYDTEEEIEHAYSQIYNLNGNEDLLRDLEVMLGELDESLNGDILNGISGALSEMDLNAVVNEALRGAEAALNAMDINAIISESMKEEGDQDIDKISREAIKGARAALDNMDINMIVHEALKGAEGALNGLQFHMDDLDDVLNDIAEGIEDAEEDLNDEEAEHSDAYHSLEENLKALENSDSENKIHKEIKKEIRKAKHVNEKYIPILEGGSEKWNRWRSDNENTVPDLSNTIVREINLQGADFSDLSLTGAEFRKTDLKKADFSGCYASDFYLNESVANGASFKQASVLRSTFYLCSLMNCDFRNANLAATSFTDCNLTGADFRNANIRGVDFNGGTIGKANFKGAIANRATRFPDGFDWKKAGIRME